MPVAEPSCIPPSKVSMMATWVMRELAVPHPQSNAAQQISTAATERTGKCFSWRPFVFCSVPNSCKKAI